MSTFLKSKTGLEGTTVSDDQNSSRIIISFAMANHGAVFAHWLRTQLMQHYMLFGTNTVYLDSVACRDAGGEIPKVFCKPNPAYAKGNFPARAKYIREDHMPNPEYDPKKDVSATNQISIPDPKEKPRVKSLEDAKREGTPPIFVDPTTGKEEVAFTLVMPDMRPGDDESNDPDSKQGKKARAIGAMLQLWDVNFRKAMSQADVMIFCYTEEWRKSDNCLLEFAQFAKLNGMREMQRKKPLQAIVLNFTNRDKPPVVNGPNVTRLDVEKKPYWLTEKTDYIIESDDLVNLIRLIGPLK
ncbi:MAG TPA: hypothetical protein VHV55_03535 [Pirellulales bacterium]|nr:hypothetical protein [Pirellulales bacterium]